MTKTEVEIIGHEVLSILESAKFHVSINPFLTIRTTEILVREAFAKHGVIAVRLESGCVVDGDMHLYNDRCRHWIHRMDIIARSYSERRA